ncbi:MAG: SPOR domain-containing protein [Candidatus Methylopumilus sp.]
MAQDNLQSQGEQEIQFKKRARRRLVGAVALVLLMIVLLPMLLQDKAAQAPREDVVISIPSQDTQLKAKDGDEMGKAEAVAPTADTQAPTANPSVADSQTAVNSASTNEAKPAEPVPAAQELQAPKKEEDKTDTATGNYYIQIGVFSDADRVKLIQAKLTERGLKSRVDLIDTSKGKKTRLRVGLFTTKKDAETALLKVKSLGLNDAVIGNE